MCNRRKFHMTEAENVKLFVLQMLTNRITGSDGY